MIQLTTQQLKHILRENDKQVSGTKKQLLERLDEFQITPPVFTKEEFKAKLLLERNGIVGNCGKLRTRDQFIRAITEMGGLKTVFEIFEVIKI
tara:strand:- start:344 stop:622 length:279 start_codon:yes stop_codon:yes gene_type:complete